MNLRKSKRGQEAVSGFSVVTIILVIFLVVVVMAILFFNDKISLLFGQVPGSEEAISKGCLVAAQGSSFVDTFCYKLDREYRKNHYVTCAYAFQNLSIPMLDSYESNQSVVNALKECNSEVLIERIKRECSLEYSNSSRVTINNQTCDKWNGVSP